MNTIDTVLAFVLGFGIGFSILKAITHTRRIKQLDNQVEKLWTALEMASRWSDKETHEVLSSYDKKFKGIESFLNIEWKKTEASEGYESKKRTFDTKEEIIKEVKELRDIQHNSTKETYAEDDYFMGMTNGIECVYSTLTGNEPNYEGPVRLKAKSKK